MGDLESETESSDAVDSDSQEEYGSDQENPQKEVKNFINNVAGMEAKLGEIQQDLAWVERLDLTTGLAPSSHGAAEGTEDDLTGDSIHDDFKREMKFYHQAQAAALEALPRLSSLGIKTKRPEDYFAEMAKTDAHMKRVREKLISKQAAMERSEKAKKLRELRKFGKKVQQEVLQKRSKEKKDMLEAVKKYRKGKQDKLDFLEDMEKGTNAAGNKKQMSQKGGKNRANPKRDYKNKKFGFGGQKKRSKYNTKASAADMSGMNTRKNSTKPGQKTKGKVQRPGKRKRQNMKNRKK